ncbi:ComEA family DNA-binding protein [Deinococcus sp.]|uniref:ComEA family DNA-binding protein n=1 Tax=Deinococcus sp. TaxID=47478 RepID=UPI003CC64A6E
MRTLAVFLSLNLLTVAAAAQTTTPAKAMPAMSCTQALKAKINLNTAPESQLICLKAVKPAVAKDIIANRPFKDAADFGKKIEDIGKKLYEVNKSNVTF